jgi:four helix bundle protein
MKDFRDLTVWRRAHELTLHVYKLTASFPAEERFGLTSQIRRCTVSIASNIAEGCGRGSDAELGRFLQIAMGSASELEYQLLLAADLAFSTSTDCDSAIQEVVQVKRMLAGFLKKLTADR